MSDSEQDDKFDETRTLLKKMQQDTHRKVMAVRELLEFVLPLHHGNKLKHLRERDDSRRHTAINNKS